jgi:hypothetical protein
MIRICASNQALPAALEKEMRYQASPRSYDRTFLDGDLSCSSGGGTISPAEDLRFGL